MTLSESARTPIGGANGASRQGVSNKDEGVWLQAAEAMRVDRSYDEGIGGSDRSLGSGMVGVLTADLSDVRLEEVARLRMAIDSGCYRIPASDLADRLIASAACGWGADRRKFD